MLTLLVLTTYIRNGFLAHVIKKKGEKTNLLHGIRQQLQRVHKIEEKKHIKAKVKEKNVRGLETD